jgi:hypothetical protein
MRILLVDDDAGLEGVAPDDVRGCRRRARRGRRCACRDGSRPEVAPRSSSSTCECRGSGLDLCRDLNADSATDGISVVLTGSNGGTAESAAAAGAARVSILAAR